MPPPAHTHRPLTHTPSTRTRPAHSHTQRHPLTHAAPTQAAGTELPDRYEPKEEGGNLDFELRLFNALRDECEGEGLGVRMCDKLECANLLMRVRNALWMMAGRETDFKCISQVCGESLKPKP